MVPAVLLFLVSFLLLPVNTIFRRHIETLKTQYWSSMEDLTGYYLESVQGITTFKLFGRDGYRQAVLAEKSRNFNDRIMEVMKVNFSSFLPHRWADLRGGGSFHLHRCRAASRGSHPIFQRADGAAAVLWIFRFGAAVDERHPLCLGRCVRCGQGGKTAVHRHHTPLRPRPAGGESALSRHPHGACVPLAIKAGRPPCGMCPWRSPREGDGPGGPFRQREVHHRLLAHAFLRLGERPHPVGGPGPVSLTPEELRRRVILVPQTVSLYSGTHPGEPAHGRPKRHRWGAAGSSGSGASQGVGAVPTGRAGHFCGGRRGENFLGASGRRWALPGAAMPGGVHPL